MRSRAGRRSTSASTTSRTRACRRAAGRASSGRLAGQRVGFDVEVHQADDGGLALSADGPVALDVAYELRADAGGGSEVSASVAVLAAARSARAPARRGDRRRPRRRRAAARARPDRGRSRRGLLGARALSAARATAPGESRDRRPSRAAARRAARPLPHRPRRDARGAMPSGAPPAAATACRPRRPRRVGGSLGRWSFALGPAACGGVAAALPARSPSAAIAPLRPLSACVNSDGITKILFASPWASCGQHLQVLVAEQLRVGVALVDRVEDRVDRLRLALGAQDRRRLARPRP